MHRSAESSSGPRIGSRPFSTALFRCSDALPRSASATLSYDLAARHGATPIGQHLARLRLGLPDGFPAAGFGRPEDSVGHEISGEAVAEGWRRRPAGPQTVDEVRNLMDERVLVADLQSRHPPMFHIRMVAVADVQGAPAAQPAFVAVIKILQA